MTLHDVAAVIAFLRKVIRIVPGFSVEAYRPHLHALHRGIQRDGPFHATSERFLIECRRASGTTAESQRHLARLRLRDAGPPARDTSRSTADPLEH